MPTFAFIVTPSDVIRLTLGALILLGIILYYGYHAVRRALCPHTRVFENGHCHAICRRCHKDLGFIGTWREKQQTQYDQE